MDFHAHQEHAKEGTALLVCLLVLGTIGMVLTLSLLASAWFYVRLGPEVGSKVFLVAAPVSAAGILLSAVVKNAQVRQGGGRYLAASLGGWPVDFNTRDQAEKQLVNIIEEISIASGVPAPTLFVLRDEPGINAFAAGWNSDNAAIGVTRGALRHLTRSELQAVIAHEFSHIANGDTQVKTRVLGWVYGIASVAILGKVLLRTLRPAGGRLTADIRAIVVIGTIGSVLVFIGSVGTWFARRGQAAISREREHLADASAVEYTRDPDSLAGALLKIGALGEQNQLITPHAEEAAHLFFESPFKSSHATHPPLAQRVTTLLPSWDLRWPELRAVKQSVNIRHDISLDGAALPEIPGLPASSAAAAQSIPGISSTPLGPILGTSLVLGSTVTARTARQPELTFQTPQLGPATNAHIDHARRLLANIPQQTKDFLHTRQGAVAAVVGLLVSEDPAVRPHELLRAGELSGFDTDSLDGASAVIGSLDRALQLPCIDIALHSIRETPSDFQHALVDVVRDFTTSSPDTDLFRWMLRRVVIRHLTDAEDDGTMQDDRDLDSLIREAAVVYSMIALFNSAGPTSRDEAFLAAHEGAGLPRPSEIPTGSALSVGNLDAALDRLAEMTADGRVAFVEGAIAAIALDGHVDIDEAELIRVIADSVRVPMPPLLPAGEAIAGGLAA